MVFDFLNNDYMKAASSFGSNIGSGILSTLEGAGDAATTTLNEAGGYLTSLNQQEDENVNIKPTINNPNTPSSATLYSTLGNTLNLKGLTSGLSNMNTPNIVGTMNNLIIPENGSSIEHPAVINSFISDTHHVDNNQYPISSMLNPALPVITDVSKLMTPYSEDAMRSLGSVLAPQSPNTMVFDPLGNLISYAGNGAQKLFNDVTDPVMNALDESGKPIKTVLWDLPYAMGGYTGNIAAKSGQITMQQIEDLMGNSKDVTVSKIKTDDGGTIVKWKPQNNPEQAKSYPAEKEAELYNKGDRYISNIPEQYKYKTYNVTKGDISNNGSSTYTHIPGQSQMLVKGLKLEGSPNDTETDKIVNSAMGNTFDPGLQQSVLNSNKMNDIASKYYYNQQQESISKEKKKNNSITPTYRKKNRFIPNIMLINNMNRMGRVSTQRVAPLAHQVSIKKKVKAYIKPVKKEKQFIYRQPDIAFKISTVMGGISNAVGGIESFVAIKPRKDVVDISNLTNNTGFKINLDGFLIKPKKKILK